MDKTLINADRKVIKAVLTQAGLLSSSAENKYNCHYVLHFRNNETKGSRFILTINDRDYNLVKDALAQLTLHHRIEPSMY